MPYDLYGNWIEDDPRIDLSDPALAPPNSRWDGEKWITTTPSEAGYDPTWGGYTTGDPRGTSTGDQWLGSVYANQGWDLPPLTGGAAPPTTPTTTTVPRPTGESSAGLSASGTQMPAMEAGWLPRFTAPTWQAPEFSYNEKFAAPTMDEARNEPGFAFAMEQGLKALENSKAAQGTYRGGATLKGLFDYANKAGEQNYGNVFNRGLQTFATNYGVARDVFDRTYQGSRDQFDRTYQGKLDEFQPNQREAELNWGRDWDQFAYAGDDAWRRYLAQLDLQKTIFGAGRS